MTKVGFIVICRTCSVEQIKITTNSIEHNYPSSEFICVNEEDISHALKKGFDNPCAEWNFVILAGKWIYPFLDKRYFNYIKSDKDILYPIINRKINFIDSTINGLFIHKNIMESFPTEGSFDHNKANWAEKVMKKGCCFKGLIGIKVC